MIQNDFDKRMRRRRSGKNWVEKIAAKSSLVVAMSKNWGAKRIETVHRGEDIWAGDHIRSR
jgi:hypothetical protein